MLNKLLLSKFLWTSQTSRIRSLDPNLRNSYLAICHLIHFNTKWILYPLSFSEHLNTLNINGGDGEGGELGGSTYGAMEKYRIRQV